MTPRRYQAGVPSLWSGPVAGARLGGLGRAHTGAGSVGELWAVLDDLGCRRPLVLCGRHLLAAGGPPAGAPAATRVVEVPPNPALPALDEAVLAGRAHRADAVVAIGGGSVIDLGKCTRAVLVTGEDLPVLAGAPIERWPGDRRDAVALVAVPTTAGSGAEANGYGGVIDEAAGHKVSLRGDAVRPDVVVLDPELTCSLGPVATVTTAANALAHCVEVAYSRARHPWSTGIAMAAASMIGAHLPTCVRDPAAIESRGHVQVGAMMAGLAIGTSMVGLHHALCHQLVAVAGVAHGTANAVVLPHALRFNAPAAPAAVLAFGRALGLGPATDAVAVADEVGSWLRALGAPWRLRDVGEVDDGTIDRMAGLAMRDRCMAFNPRPATVDEVREIYRAAC